MVSLINIDKNIDSWPDNDKIHLSSNPMEQVLFKVGVQYGPVDLDPQVAWDSSSINVIHQVCEGLFAYNLSDPDMPIIPNLALSGIWNPAGTEYTCILRQGVTFHDGAPFNASAVIFTWDRMSWALNTTGTNTVGVTQVAELYEFPNGTPIVSSITKNGDYNITFNLAGPYLPFQALLCFSASYVLSPSSTPAEAYIHTATGDIIGTGPFVYDNCTADVEVNFHAFDNYWKGKANINEMRFQIITDTTNRNLALLSGAIDFLSSPLYSMFDMFNTTEGITLEEGPQSTVTNYLGMNNQQINTTWREAIAYAIDYDYIIDVLNSGYAAKMESPIPEGITYANWSFDEASLDVPYARTVVQSMGYGVGLDVTVDGPDEAVWQASSFFTVNFTYNTGNLFREAILILLQNNLGKIGIVVENAGVTWEQFIHRLYEVDALHRNMLQLYWIGWGPDYNDPSNFINPLFTNRSVASNGAQYNGYTAAIEAGRDPLALNDNVQLLMEAGIVETDPITREAIYDRIQELLIEEDRPWVWGYVSNIYHAYNNHLTGFQQNAMNKLYFFPCEWSTPILPGPMSINSDADVPDTDGNFNITWSSSTYADNYSLYVSSSPITVIDGSVTVLLDEDTDSSYEVTGYSDGNYYFQVIARNGNGITSSSNLLINVDIPAPPSPFTLSSDAGSPDANGNFDLTWTPSTFADTYSLYVYSSLITEINDSLTLLLNDVTDLSYEALDYSDGTYFFAVVAKNVDGTIMSNNIEVVVNIDEPDSGPGIPGFEMWTMFFSISSVALILLLRQKKKIT